MIRTPAEIEQHRRIKLSIWAYAYEFENVSLVSDAVFDVESYQVNLNIATNRPDLDYWFMGFFQPCTGMWIHKHPDLERIKEIYREHHT